MTRTRFACNKLIRDKVPERLKKKNIISHEHIMEQDEYQASLLQKLLEEAQECQEAENKQELLEELGDVLEIVHALAKAYDLDIKTIEEHRAAKKETHGGFDKKIYCTFIEVDETNPFYNNYALRPHKYPVIK